MGSNITKTFVLIKPDAVERGIVSNIISRFLEEGFIIEMLNCLYSSDEQITKMYADNIVVNGNCYRHNLINYLSNKIVIAICFSIIGNRDAIDVARKLIGYYDPKKSNPGTIRFDYGIDSLDEATKNNRCCFNLVHAASNYDEYILDMNIWFPDVIQSK